MKNLRFALVVLASAAGIARAQDDQQQQRPPTEIPDFSNLDEYIYEPKSILSYGYRNLSGAKMQFAGKGSLAATGEDPGALTGRNLARIYHDGSVSPDSRTAPRLDSSGNPVRDPDTGSQIFDPISPDGRTNTWAYQNSSQASTEGYIAFHSYTAEVTDAGVRTKDSNSNFGMEVAVSRDMGKIRNSRFTWQLIAGLSVNDITGSKNDAMRAQITSLTDLYSLGGMVAPAAPYSAPSSSTTTVLDSAGNPVLNADGTAQTVTTDTTVLLDNQPTVRTTDTKEGIVNNRWKVTGAYFTFRGGASILLPFTSRFRMMVSAGPALMYAGSNYSVTQTLQPDTGSEITDTSQSSTSHLMPGYFADAALQYDITERTGFYAGAVFQQSGSYTQDVNSDAAHYTTKIDLGRQQGFRSGVTIRF
jgi:hypothetical protein